MTNNINYEYINETSITPELICIICSIPFHDPMCTPCDHTFCRECITGWINGGNASCPMCRQHPILVNSLVRANRTVRNIVDHLSVKCVWCGEAELQRCNFDEHMGRECSKMIVSCPSADIKCSWKGTRDQLNNHVAKCPYHPFRAIVTELVAKNQQLEEQVKQQEITLNRLTKQLANNTNTESNIKSSSYQNKSCDSCRHCLYLDAGGRNAAGFYHAYAYNHQTYNYDGHTRHGISIALCDCHCHKQ